MTAQAASPRIRSRESDAAAVSLRGIQREDMEDGESERAPDSGSMVRVAIDSLRHFVLKAEKQATV
jgi:hypothetical protein